MGCPTTSLAESHTPRQAASSTHASYLCGTCPRMGRTCLGLSMDKAGAASYGRSTHNKPTASLHVCPCRGAHLSISKGGWVRMTLAPRSTFAATLRGRRTQMLFSAIGLVHRGWANACCAAHCVSVYEGLWVTSPGMHRPRRWGSLQPRAEGFLVACLAASAAEPCLEGASWWAGVCKAEQRACTSNNPMPCKGPLTVPGRPDDVLPKLPLQLTQQLQLQPAPNLAPESKCTWTNLFAPGSVRTGWLPETMSSASAGLPAVAPLLWKGESGTGLLACSGPRASAARSMRCSTSATDLSCGCGEEERCRGSSRRDL